MRRSACVVALVWTGTLLAAEMPPVSSSSRTYVDLDAETVVQNSSAQAKAFTLQVEVVAPDGRAAASTNSQGTAYAGASQALIQQMTVPGPQL